MPVPSMMSMIGLSFEAELSLEGFEGSNAWQQPLHGKESAGAASESLAVAGMQPASASAAKPCTSLSRLLIVSSAFQCRQLNRDNPSSSLCYHYSPTIPIYRRAPNTYSTSKHVIRPGEGLTPFSKPWRPVSLSVQNASVGDRLT